MKRQPTSLMKLSGMPHVSCLQSAPDTTELFRRIQHLPHCVFLDSALRHPQLGRYSFLAADPFEVIEVAVGDADPMERLRARLDEFSGKRRDDLPPFQGGAAGVFGYELGESIETVGVGDGQFKFPAISIGLYDVVLAVDHLTKNTWIISQGWPETDMHRRRARAHQRLIMFHDLVSRKRETSDASDVRLNAPTAVLGPHHPVDGRPGVFSNFTADGYQQAIQQVVDLIRAGDIFQANLSQRLLVANHLPAEALYLRLRKKTAATFAGFYNGGDFQIISASPERFLKKQGQKIEARPIKGTRPIVNHPEVDMANAADLADSEKDRAENIMIVDLLRNDLSRVCDPDSLQVTQLCGLESYGYVQHLVSVIEGVLQTEKTALDAIHAAFPGGSITGAPKLRARQIIREIEQVSRGAYTGSLGYIGFDGSMDLNILIRTITASQGWWQFPVGGGITARSEPDSEWKETWHKAAGLLRAIEE